MSENKKCVVTIFGDEYTLVTTESEKHVMESATSVDQLMKAIAKQAPSYEVKRVAVLAALRLASKVLELEQKLQAQQIHMQELVKDLDSAMWS